MNEEKYLIPKRLLKKSTMFDGIGMKEMLIIGAGALLGLLLFNISSNIFNNIFINLFLFAVPPLICYGLVAPLLPYHENAITYVKRMLNFSSSKKTYYFSRPYGYLKTVSEILLKSYER